MCAIVIDNGSGTCKAGFSGEDIPRVILPSVVGRQRHRMVMVGVESKDVYVGEDALNKRGLLELKHPLHEGLFTNWQDLEAIWSHLFFNELDVLPDEYPVLLTESPLNPRTDREEMTRIMFDVFNAAAVHIAMQQILSLYASGRTTGVLVESGHTLTCAVPVVEGCALPHAIVSMTLAGRDLTYHLEHLLTERGFYFNSSHEREMVADMKEKLCYVVLDFGAEVAAGSGHEVRYELPEGGFASIGSACFQCPELLFQPSLGSVHAQGLHCITYEAIAKCQADLRGELVANIVCAGGSTLFPGMAERMAKELKTLFSELSAELSSRVKVVAPASRGHAAWLGGSTISSVSAFERMWLTSEEYAEGGSALVHERSMYSVNSVHDA
mmetsp:Transcript_39088/g.72837  ORF Transcript_39088/g.72837 Transcript_39088/m.72837 type:complete len:383 (+) Transcript_39088:62-1210(+)